MQNLPQKQANGHETRPVRLIDQNAVAEMYGICAKTALRWARSGRIPKPHVDRPNFKRWLYSAVADHIENMDKAQLQEAAS